MGKRVIIIGAGIGGLATGALLGKMGYHVTILEKNAGIGGRARLLKSKGFTFDAGPGWYFMPEVYETFFKLFRKKSSDFYKLKRLDPQFRAFFNPQDILDVDKTLSVTLRDFLNNAKHQQRIVMDELIYKNYDSVLNVFNPTLFSDVPKFHMFESLEKYVSRYTDDEKLQKILMYYVLLLGGSPKNTPAFYSMLSYADFHNGVFYPVGGLYKIVEALEKLCKENDVVIKTGQEVNRIGVRGKEAAYAETKSKKYAADIFISNADYPFTEIHMLDPKYQSRPAHYWRTKTIGSSAFVLHLGIKGKLKKLKHHNVFFSPGWDTHFDEIFGDEEWPTNPSFYISCPSKTDATVAPRGCEVVSVLVPVASGLEDNEAIRTKYAAKIIAQLEKLTGERIKKNIITQRIFSIRDYQTLFNSYNGTAFGLANTLSQLGLFRPSNRSKKVKNLYYVGHYTVPGTGMPMSVISSQLVAERIRNEQ